MTKQEKLDLSYMGGLFDGEGSIFIGRIKTPRNKSGYLFNLHIEMCNTNEWIIKWVQLYFGGYVCERYTQSKTRRTLWAWHLSSKKAMDFLCIIAPYLRIKRHQAELAIEFQGRQVLGRYTREHTNVLDEADCILMSKLNKGRA